MEGGTQMEGLSVFIRLQSRERGGEWIVSRLSRMMDVDVECQRSLLSSSFFSSVPHALCGAPVCLWVDVNERIQEREIN